MKRLFILFLICTLLFVGCNSEEPQSSTIQPTETESTELTDATESSEWFMQLPRGLEGEWVSATADERGYTEMITFFTDGTLTVSSLKNGEIQQTIYGYFHVNSDTIYFDIEEGTTPYQGSFEYAIDGRELTLVDEDGPAHFLRTS